MLELLGSGLLGSIFGGIFRILPEVIKFFDAKNERAHELEMFRLQTELEKMKGNFQMEAKYVDFSTAQMSAIQEAMKQQGEADARAYKWVASVSALVRPGITFIMFIAYLLVKAHTIGYGMSQGASWHDLVDLAWGTEDFAILNMILTFWFVGRAIEKYKGVAQ